MRQGSELCDSLAGLSLGWEDALHSETQPIMVHNAADGSTLETHTTTFKNLQHAQLQGLSSGNTPRSSATFMRTSDVFQQGVGGLNDGLARLTRHSCGSLGMERDFGAAPRAPENLPPKECGPSNSNSSWQAKVLKVINTFHTKEELLSYVSSVHAQLDEINLVTIIYRLARMFSAVRSPPSRRRWSSELQADTTFQLLLGAIQGHLLRALQLICDGPSKGRIQLDARGVSNLIWGVVKLELASKPGSIGNDMLQISAPIVLHVLPNSSSQGLANLLWAYSKLPMPPSHIKVMMAISAEMTIRLRNEAERFDAQALSNSIWALAHIRMPVADMDAAAGNSGATLQFMLALAARALGALRLLHTSAAPHRMQASMQEAEKRFSAQALVNICWGFASLLEEACSQVPAIRTLFSSIRAEALIRLQATSTALQLDQQWMIHLQGGFNEQALSNIIFAFEKARLLDPDLLQLVYDVAALRLDKTRGFSAMFKSQEICTLLRAVHLNLAQPWFFLRKLQAMLLSFPHVVQSWSTGERLELDRALGLLEVYNSTCLLRQLQMEQQQAVQEQVSAMLNNPPGNLLLAAPGLNHSMGHASFFG